LKIQVPDKQTLHPTLPKTAKHDSTLVPSPRLGGVHRG
jgi:hypothetical protein